MPAALLVPSTISHPRADAASIPLEAVTFAVLDVRTTGLVAETDRVVELAVTRVRADGTVEDEFATLIDPGCPPGPAFLHHITDELLSSAPPFAAVAGDVVARLAGCVAVAHTTAVESAFLRAEFDRAGIALPSVPSLDTLHLARTHLPTDNHRLRTCCDRLGIALPRGRSALDRARATGRLVVQLARIAAADLAPAHVVSPVPLPALPVLPTGTRTTRRPTDLGAILGGTGSAWTRPLLTRVPESAFADPATPAGRYLEALADGVEDGDLTGEQAIRMADLAVRAGISRPEIAALNELFLNGLHAAASQDRRAAAEELELLATVAAALGRPVESPAPSRKAASRPRTATTHQVLLLAAGREAEALRAAIEDNGSSHTTALAPGVSLVAVDADHVEDPQVTRALIAGIPVFPVAALWEQFGVAPPAQNQENPWDPAEPVEPATGEPQPDSPALADTAERATPALGATVPVDSGPPGHAVHLGQADQFGTAGQAAPAGSTVVVDLVTTEVPAERGQVIRPRQPAAEETDGPRLTRTEVAAAMLARPDPALPPANWYADPTRRFQYRYWNGTQWTHHVASHGQQAFDPMT